MASETIVAVFPSLTHAEAAISDLVAAGVPSTSIRHYARDEADTGAEPIHSGVDTQQHRHGFWAWLTGEDNNTEHHAVYDRSIESGRTVVTVVSDGTNIDHIYATLERHEPLDLDEHTGSDRLGGAEVTPHATTGAAGAGIMTGQATAGDRLGSGMTGGGYEATADRDTGVTGAAGAGFTPRVAGATDATRTGSTEEVMALSEETLQVGKRAVDHGTTRIRRYVVERPIEEQIRLRDETVSVFRRPVTGTATIGADAFRDREVVVNETSEEAVVGKTARVIEEVVVQKNVQDRVETVHDTVRREEVEIDNPTGRDMAADRHPGAKI